MAKAGGYTFKEFKAEYPDDGACLDRIMLVQYGGTQFDCPGCGVASKFHRISKRRAYACQHCGHHIYPCVGTPFEKSRTPLTNWFFAMYLFTSTRHGVAAKELQRQLGCTYKTAWRIAHELRKLMANADFGGRLGGNVEVDETYVGGKTRGGKKGRGSPNKTVVFGIVERGGKIFAGPVGDLSRDTLQRLITRNVEAGTNVHTDDFPSYRGLDKAGYQHFVVRHVDGEYSRGDGIHTNTIEGFWARLKLSIRGTHVHVSRKHLWKYVSEFSYRYNHRNTQAAMFNRLVAAFSMPRLQEG